MTDSHFQPISAKSIATNGEANITPWAVAQQQLAAEERYWMSTLNRDGSPHVMPHFAVWLDGALYFTSSPGAQKAKNLARDPRCVISVSAQSLDIIMEGEAQKITDDTTLQRLADAYKAKYDWPITVKDHAYDAPYGAPTAGPPPYELYQVTLSKVFGLGSGEPYGATRWEFA